MFLLLTMAFYLLLKTTQSDCGIWDRPTQLYYSELVLWVIIIIIIIIIIIVLIIIIIRIIIMMIITIIIMINN
jgi:hypothetical protein